MKYKTAMATVFAKYGSPRTRAHVVSLLERYSNATRPVTAWNALGEDAEAARLLLETLGFRETADFTVQTSVLDPSATRFSWTNSGTELVARMTSELAGVDFAKVQRRVLLGAPDPLDPLPDVEPDGAEAEAEADDFVELVLDKTRDVAARLAAAKETCTALLAADASIISAWADKVLAGYEDMDPVAPLAALEALARAEGLGGLPEFRVFSPVFYDGWQASRPVAGDEDVVPAGSVNCLPLAEQCADYGGLADYVAWTIDTWRKSPRGRRAVWTQFDAEIAQTPQAVNFALDAERMRAFVQAIVENGYRGFGCCLVPTTRVGVHNLALDGKVPGSEDLADEDGEASQVQCRIEDSPLASSTVLYMGAHVMSPHPAPERHWVCATHPVQVVSSADEASDEKNAANAGITTEELAEEWFLMTHEGSHYSIPGSHPEASASLAAFRVTARCLRESPARIAAMCMPSNPRFAANDCGAFTTPGTLLNGICAAMRKYGRNGLGFVNDSPYSPDMFVAGVWSGLATDLAPESADEARDTGVFPNFGGACSFQSGYADTDRAAMTDFLALMRENPHVQLKFGKRTRNTHRRHVIVIETNVDAKRFLGGLDAGAARQLRQAAWQAFYTSMLAGRFDPLAAVDAAFSAYSTYNETLYRLAMAVSKTVPDWKVSMQDSEFPANAPASFGFGWREDSLGRLVVVVSTEAPLLALRAKLVYRHLAGLPLASARYLAMHGQADAAVLTPDMTPEQGFAEVIRAAVRQTGFDAYLNRTNDSFGRFGPIWAVEALQDLDEDEIPGRTWYRCNPVGDNVGLAGQYIGDNLPF